MNNNPMGRKRHIATQAAGTVDDVIEQMENGRQPDPTDVAIMRANLRAALEAGIHPDEINAIRRTTPQ